MNSMQILKFNDCIFDRFDDQTFLEEYKKKSQLLQTQKYNKILAKKRLYLLNEENKNKTERLLQKKKDYENLKSELTRKLYSIEVITGKDKILSKMKFDEYLSRKNSCQNLRKDLLSHELEELTKANSSLFEECEKVNILLKTTKKQYYEMIEYTRKDFREKVCEFCDTALKLKSVYNITCYCTNFCS